MNPPTRNRLTDSGVRLATVATVGMPWAAISSHAGASSARKAATTRCVTALGTMLRYIARWSAAKSNSAHDAGARIACDVRGGRRERGRERIGDRIVAVTEVLVEDLATDSGARDDVADRHLVDRTLVGQRERRVPKPGADPLRAGIDTVGACCHIRSLEDFVDN